MNKILLLSLILISAPLFSQTWISLANTPAGRHHPITFSLNGKGYSVTGTSSTNQLTNTVFDYNPVTDSWGTLPNFPGAARSYGIGTVANGKAYIGFGVSSTQYLNDLWSFDDTDSSWTRLADCICLARRHPAMIAKGNKIYVGLGNDVNGDLRDWWVYDIISNSWSQMANLPGPARHHPYMFNAGGEVFAGLGHSGQTVYRDWYKLDQNTNTWTLMNIFPGQGRVAGTQFEANGFGYVLSGDGQNHNYMATGEMWRYDPGLDSWTPLTPHPGRSKWAPGSFVINNEVYFFGGLNRFTNQFPLGLWKYNLGNLTTGINEEQANLSNTYVYPNPANNQLFWNSDERITEIAIYNTLGQLFYTGNSAEGKMDVSNLDNGLYLVQFFDNTKLIKSSKVLIQH